MDFKEAIILGTKNLTPFGFQIDKCEDLGMHKYAELINNNFILTFSYDRGIIESYIEYKDKFKFDIVQLANALCKKTLYCFPDYQKEMLEVIREYSQILINEFQKIDKYLKNTSDNELKKCEEDCVRQASKDWGAIWQAKS